MTNTTNRQIEPPIREFIATNLLYSKEGFTYADDASLLREGIIDSLGVVELVEFLQKNFGVKVEQQESAAGQFRFSRKTGRLREAQNGWSACPKMIGGQHPASAGKVSAFVDHSANLKP